MSVPGAGDPRVQLKNGQAIHACSHGHAQTLYDNLLAYQENDASTSATPTPTSTPTTPPTPEELYCPVCHMPVDKSMPSLQIKGNQTVYFCNMGGHREVFLASPEKYISGVKSSTSASKVMGMGGMDGSSSSGMSCPVCGMAVPAEGDPHVELRNGQVIHTCSESHAMKVHDDLAAYVVATPAPKEDEFCYGSGTVMLNGLVFNPSACVKVVVDGWVIDSRVKLALSILGVFALAFGSEWLHAFRRVRNEKFRSSEYQLLFVKKGGKRRLPPNFTHHMIQSLLYGTNITLAYFLMLTAMTYHAGLFVAIMGGFTVGYMVFRREEPVSDERDEPCCD
eukprot:Colp12_sorted_trinity150504_noHs@24618